MRSTSSSVGLQCSLINLHTEWNACLESVLYLELMQISSHRDTRPLPFSANRWESLPIPHTNDLGSLDIVTPALSINAASEDVESIRLLMTRSDRSIV